MRYIAFDWSLYQHFETSTHSQGLQSGHRSARRSLSHQLSLWAAVLFVATGMQLSAKRRWGCEIKLWLLQDAFDASRLSTPSNLEYAALRRTMITTQSSRDMGYNFQRWKIGSCCLFWQAKFLPFFFATTLPLCSWSAFMRNTHIRRLFSLGFASFIFIILLQLLLSALVILHALKKIVLNRLQPNEHACKALYHRCDGFHWVFREFWMFNSTGCYFRVV